ncbi:MAG: TetR/AcrR family transcriptional regulator [Candidatus Binatia bacterium]
MFQSALVEERALRIVDTAIALAERGGFEAVRLRDVAAEAGVALGTLYRHFRSKEDLLVAALAREVSRLENHMEKRPATGRDPLERVTAFFAAATRGLCQKPKLAQAVLRSVASSDHELTEQVSRFHGRVTAMVEKALAGDDLNSTETPSAGGEFSVALILQHVWFASLVGWAGGLHDQKTVTAKVRVAADLLLRGQAKG